MVTFFTDLDSTMIYSHRREIQVPVRWVEMLEGRQQSYMTERTYSFFRRQNTLNVVPVSTRTVEQYQRLLPLFEQLGWHNALVCNGAVLVIDGKVDERWSEESAAAAQRDNAALAKVRAIVQSMYAPEDIAFAEPYLFYVKAGEEKVASLYQLLKEQADPQHIMIHRDTRKVYAVPKSLSKGAAIKRYMQRFPCDYSIAAGDSSFDVPMLEAADWCIYPEAISDLVCCNVMKTVCTGVFSDAICSELEKNINKELTL